MLLNTYSNGNDYVSYGTVKRILLGELVWVSLFHFIVHSYAIVLLAKYNLTALQFTPQMSRKINES